MKSIVKGVHRVLVEDRKPGENKTKQKKSKPKKTKQILTEELKSVHNKNTRYR